MRQHQRGVENKIHPDRQPRGVAIADEHFRPVLQYRIRDRSGWRVVQGVHCRNEEVRRKPIDIVWIPPHCDTAHDRIPGVECLADRLAKKRSPRSVPAGCVVSRDRAGAIARRCMRCQQEQETRHRRNGASTDCRHWGPIHRTTATLPSWRVDTTRGHGDGERCGRIRGTPSAGVLRFRQALER
jgi:hypothetical protein